MESSTDSVHAVVLNGDRPTEATNDEVNDSGNDGRFSTIEKTNSRVEGLEDAIRALEVQLARLTVRVGGHGAPPPPPPPPPISQKPVIAKLNAQHWAGFQLAPRRDVAHCFDVLVGEPKLRRARARKVSDLMGGPSIADDSEEDEVQELLAVERLTKSSNADAEKELEAMRGIGMPDRIRLGSFAAQYLFRNILKCGASIPHGLNPRGIILLRPFKPLFQVHGQEAFDVRLKDLLDCFIEFERYGGQKKSKAENPGTVSEADGVALDLDDVTSILRKTGLMCCEDCTRMLCLDIPDTAKARDLVQSICDFFLAYLKPIHERYRSRTEKQIRFCDLWHLFKPGDELGVRQKAETTIHNGPCHASLLRVLRVQGGRRLARLSPPPPPPPPLIIGPNGQPIPATNVPPPPPQPVAGFIPFTIDAYYFDCAKTGLAAQRRRFYIDPYHGLRDIADLVVYPSEYLKDEHISRSICASYGRAFLEYINAQEGTHRECRGRELEANNELNEQVLVDMKECWKEDDLAQPVAYSQPEPIDASETNTCNNCNWFDQHCPHGISRIFPDAYVDQEKMDSHVENQAIFQGISIDNSVQLTLTENDLAICAYRVYAYSLPSKSWVRVHVKDLHQVRVGGNGAGFDLLVIPEDHKKYLISQVQEHFRRKMTLGLNPERSVDLVRGKGQGLIILLHGAPGVGKTATAECMADLMRRPLYSITCGDLGSNAQEIEQELRYHLRLASQWDCILLLDEADVFLARRDGQDHERNAIVSVFLRILEYYKGVLFLTTNRVGSFDEAFTSRIHISLFYENFDKDTTLEVWDTFIEQTKKTYEGLNFQIDIAGIKEFARKHFDHHGKDSRWNGRQIRNAFSTAIAMAEYQSRTKKLKTFEIDPVLYATTTGVKVKLGPRQFEKISKTVEEFNDYMEKTLGASYGAKMEKEKMRKSDYKRKDNKKEQDGESYKKSSKRSKAKYKDSSSDSSESSDTSDARSRKHGRSKTKAEKKRAKSSNSDSDSDSN